MAAHNFPDIALLVTHYNRSKSLERLLEAFRKLDCSFGEIVVSDDGSKEEHQAYLRKLSTTYHFNLVTTPKNKGLGNNINKGQDAVTKPYTLYVQEDFDPFPIFIEKLKAAHKYMEQDKGLDVVRFYAYFRYPYLKPLGDGFGEMKFGLLKPGYKKFYQYSDHPHLRRTDFLTRFGRYPEGVKGDVTEYGMMMNFLKRKGRGLFYEDFKGLFDQINSADEPSTMKRDYWRESNNPLVTLARHLYRHYKFNRDYIRWK